MKYSVPVLLQYYFIYLTSSLRCVFCFQILALETEFYEKKSCLVIDGESAINSLEGVLGEVKKCLEESPSLLSSSPDTLSDSEDALSEIYKTEQQLAYLRWIETMQDQRSESNHTCFFYQKLFFCSRSDRIRSALACEAMSDATNFMQTFVDWCDEFRDSKCQNLLEYLHKLTSFWIEIISDQIARYSRYYWKRIFKYHWNCDFRELPQIFNHIGYPRSASAQKPLMSSVDSKSKMQISEIVRSLLNIRIPYVVWL